MKLSVIIPCYNVEKYLSKCIDSVIDNHLEDLEIILVNDGSKDNTINIINDYKNKYPNIIEVIDQKNQGLSMARNAGIEKATGDYITFLDSDDYVDNDFYRKLMDKVKEYQYDIVVADVKMIYIDHDIIVNLGIEKDCKTKEEVKELMPTLYPAACNKIYRKEFIKEFKFKKGVWFEDVEFLYKIFPNIESIGLVKDTYYNYLQREGSITYVYNEKLYDFAYNLNGVIDYYKEKNLYDDYKHEIEYVYVRYLFATFIKRLAKSKNKKEFNKGFNFVMESVREKFPNYKKNKYLVGKKGIYLKYFNKMLANIIYIVEKNRMN